MTQLATVLAGIERRAADTDAQRWVRQRARAIKAAVADMERERAREMGHG